MRSTAISGMRQNQKCTTQEASPIFCNNCTWKVTSKFYTDFLKGHWKFNREKK